MNDFTAETPNGQFSPVGKSSASVFDGGNLKGVIDQLVKRFSAALKIDRDEVENAKAAANGPLCSNGYDADATAANFLQAEQELCKNLDALVGSEAMSVMSADFPDGFSSGDGAGLAGMLLSTADAPTRNQNPYDGREKARANLDGVIEDSQTTGTPGWQSRAGDAYRQNAADRTVEAVSLQPLATNSRDTLEALVQVQATIVDAMSRSSTANSKHAQGTPQQNAPRRQLLNSRVRSI